MKKLLTVVLSLILLVLMIGCAPGTSVEVTTPETNIELSIPSTNPLVNEPADNGSVAGVIQGLWHGVIAPVTLIMSFFNEAVQMYEVHNNGREYNLGFLLGVALVFLILGFSGSRWR